MSKAYKCDRCGKLFEYGEGHERNTLPLIIHNTGFGCDLCKECDDSLDNWFRNPELTWIISHKEVTYNETKS